MPAVSTVFRWLRNNADFRQQYAVAREIQADVLPDEPTWRELYDRLQTEEDDSVIVDTLVPALRKENRKRKRTILVMLENLNEITTQVEKVSAVMGEIAAASEQQTEGVEQINNAVNHMNQVIQQNASGSEEMASTAEELSSQAEQLQSTMEFFKMDDKRSSGVRRTKVVPDKAKEVPHTEFTPLIQKAKEEKEPVPAEVKAEAKGYELDLEDNGKKGDSLDDEFEKY